MRGSPAPQEQGPRADLRSELRLRRSIGQRPNPGALLFLSCKPVIRRANRAGLQRKPTSYQVRSANRILSLLRPLTPCPKFISEEHSFFLGDLGVFLFPTTFCCRWRRPLIFLLEEIGD